MANTIPDAKRSSRSSNRPPMGFIIGCDTHTTFSPASDSRMILGTTDILRLSQKGARYRRFHVYPNYLRSPLKHDFKGTTMIVNLVTDPDLHPRILAVSKTMLKGFRGRILNPPDAVLGNTRDAVASKLQGIADLTMPVTIRLPRDQEAVPAAVGEAGIRFPAMFREIGTHSGRSLHLVETLDQVLATMKPGKDYYLTQFVDTRGVDGLFRKVRAFCFGRNWIVRHQLVCDHWKVHSVNGNDFMATRPHLMAEEVEVVTAGVEGLPARIQVALEQARRKLGLDFFGIDFAIGTDGGLVVFEANATMNLLPVSTGPGFAHMEAVRDKAARALQAMLAEPSQPGRRR